ncbi:NAD(P)-binding protein [Silvanigrella aquatica]|uniref:Spermidine dehydrogenase n=1 Tax=Silvanigrella aquatica TaxID=1915309 RepID=A0A1L4D3K3_9BACT|nr:FAD/NAD(P)-binding protein [Silvanigrella aquatica]APJ04794.1 spermidine dehydrogenase [Silvanigrella aquatica]
MSITRRDFLNGVSIGIVAGLTPIEFLNASSSSTYYPPSLTGIRGNHPGSFEKAHQLGREGRTFPIDDLSIEEKYDLVVVGAGISGLAAARFYQKKYGKKSKILILDNHDDFGGHAKRNEFTINGKQIIAYGGTESLQSPKSLYSENALGLLKDISVDIDELGRCFNRSFYPKLGLSRGVFFDKETFGQDKMVAGDPGRTVADDIAPKELNGKSIHDFINDFPLSAKDKEDLITLHEKKINYLPGMNETQCVEYLSKTSYRNYLLKNVKLSEKAVLYFQARSNDFFAYGLESVPALDARILALPGFDGLPIPPLSPEEAAELNDPYIYHFPDGNASLARLLVRKMIPQVAPGKTMKDIVLAKFDYSKLDIPGNNVRLRLNSTVVTVKDPHGDVQIGYMDKNGKLHRIQANHSIMAGYNMMIPHIVKEMPQDQKAALAKNVKLSTIYSKVIIRNWQAFAKLGVHEIYTPKMPYTRVKLDYPVNIGGYSHSQNPNEPICLHMVSVPISSDTTQDLRTKARVARYKLLTTPFDELEKDIRNQLQRMFGSVGFNHKKDILGITINRWAHGYSYFENSLYDDENEAEKTIETARMPLGNVTIANSDSGWEALSHTAIDMAYRAVSELTKKA